MGSTSFWIPGVPGELSHQAGEFEKRTRYRPPEICCKPEKQDEYAEDQTGDPALSGGSGLGGDIPGAPGFRLGEVRKFAKFVRCVAEARSRSSIEKRKGFAPRASAQERG